MINLRDRQLRGGNIGRIVGPPEPLAGDPIPKLSDADFRGRKFRAQGFHHLVKRHAHRSLLLVLGNRDNIEKRARGGREIVRHPSEHRIRNRVRVDLPKKGQQGQLPGSAIAHLLRGIRDAEGDVAAEPSAVDLVADFPSIDLRKGGDEIDEALFVLGARVLAVVAGIHGLTEHFQAFGFRVIDQSRVGRWTLACVKDHPDPAVGRGERGRQIQIRLIV